MEARKGGEELEGMKGITSGGGCAEEASGIYELIGVPLDKI